MSLELRPIDPRSASQAEYRAMTEFWNRMRSEVLPDDPPIPLEERIAGWKNLPDFVRVVAWTFWGAEEIVAVGNADYLQLEENRHVLDFEIRVLPPYRRQGLGKRLFGYLVETAERTGKRLMLTNTNERVPGGAAFMERIGAARGLETHTNQLDLRELDPNLIHGWLEQGVASGYTLGFWEGPYPEDELAEFARFMAVMNTAPRDDLDVEDFKYSPELVRQIERSLFAAGNRRWTYWVKAPDGRFAGYSEITWNPSRPQILHQQGTGVEPEFRGHGLGRWLKATMLERVLREMPQARFVRTGNADSNAPMLRINHQLGFKPYLSTIVWQVETAKARAYLNG
ncbi:MAG TPA: GNAT family N-acetyltransferase [Meiothermus sp.]|nr:GNAT family N-acetyltransferase [Meiothermus sp.]